MTGGRPDGPADHITLAQATAGAMDATFMVEGDGTILYVNPVVEHVLGWDPDELLGTNLVSLLHPEDVEPILAAVARVEEEGPHARSTTHIRVRQHDGGWAHFSLGGNLIEGEDTRFLTVFRRADDLEAVFDLITRLSESDDMGAVLGGLPRFIQWRHDAPLTTIVWEEADQRHASGDTVPSELCGLVDSDDESPWTRAWVGEERLGLATDLPDPLRAQAQGAGLAAYWVRPVEGLNGD